MDYQCQTDHFLKFRVLRSDCPSLNRGAKHRYFEAAYGLIRRMQDARTQEELVTARRAQVLGMNYVDTSKLQKQLFKNILPANDLRSLHVVPLVADAHNIHFGVLTTTSQQTINRLRAGFTDQRVTF